MDERLRVLEMVREGKLSVEEADNLLGALQAERSPAGPKGRLLRVRVAGHRGEVMTFAVPLALADTILRFLPKGLRLTTEGREVDVGRLLADVQESGTLGTILDARDSRGTHIEVAVE